MKRSLPHEVCWSKRQSQREREEEEERSREEERERERERKRKRDRERKREREREGPKLTALAVLYPALEIVYHAGQVGLVCRAASQCHGSGGDGQAIVAELHLFIVVLFQNVLFCLLNGILCMQNWDKQIHTFM